MTGWTYDDCWDTRQIFDAKQARGILKIHARCDPSCPRKQTAAQVVMVDTDSTVPLIDRWLIQSQDCATDPGELPLDQARYVLGLHLGHGPHCWQYFAALEAVAPERVTGGVHENCAVGWFGFLPNPQWARAILDQHATCSPRCPRMEAAAEYLAGPEESPPDTADGTST